jgi:hypothetical protein
MTRYAGVEAGWKWLRLTFQSLGQFEKVDSQIRAGQISRSLRKADEPTKRMDSAKGVTDRDITLKEEVEEV